MTVRTTVATAARVLRQLRHDHRTVALMLLVPCLLVTLLWWVWIDQEALFDQVAPAMLGIFPFLTMFLVTSVATLRERQSGTLERLLTMPMGKLDLLLGYLIGFGVLAVVQATLVTAVALGPLDVDVAGPGWLLVVVCVVDALLGVSLGLFVSAFAHTEFQAVQFMPAVVLPQFFLCGLLVPRDELPRFLEVLSDLAPLSYAVDATGAIARYADPSVGGDLLVVAGFAVAALVLGAATLRRTTQ